MEVFIFLAVATLAAFLVATIAYNALKGRPQFWWTRERKINVWLIIISDEIKYLRRLGNYSSGVEVLRKERRIARLRSRLHRRYGVVTNYTPGEWMEHELP